MFLYVIALMIVSESQIVIVKNDFLNVFYKSQDTFMPNDLKVHSTDFTHGDQFTRYKEYFTACKNS